MPQKHKKKKKIKKKTFDETCEDSRFAFIAGFTEGGVPYGLTWEESDNTEKQELQASKASLITEITYIVNRAAAHDTRVVSWGPLIFFSTESGDAWVLDPEDKLAICLARDGAILRNQPTLIDCCQNLSFDCQTANLFRRNYIQCKNQSC